MNRNRRTLVGLILGLAALLLAPQSWAQSSGRGTLTIEVLDVGQGDSIFIRSPEGKTALIDAGPTREGAVQLLRRQGVERIDLAVVSHHHSDHYGGMDQIVRRLAPRYFLATRSGHTTRMYLKLLETVESEGLTMIEPTDKPRRIELGSVELMVFPQTPEDRRDENNNSIGIRLVHGNFSMLLTGDSEEQERSAWLRTIPELVERSTVLKLAHHGSRNGVDSRWLARVRPELAVVSVGRGNDYGHPHPETLSLLKREAIPLLRTDVFGTIVIESDGRGWRVVSPQLSSRGPPLQDELDRVAAEIDANPTVRPRTARVR